MLLVYWFLSWNHPDRYWKLFFQESLLLEDEGFVDFFNNFLALPVSVVIFWCVTCFYDRFIRSCSGICGSYICKWRLHKEWFNPLNFNISMHILHTYLCTFSVVLLRRICQTTRASFKSGTTSFIRMALLSDSEVILYREIIWQLLLGIKGLCKWSFCNILNMTCSE